MNIYELIYEDLTHLGGSMGTEYTTDHSLGLFSVLNSAKKKAEADYGKSIKWYGEDEDGDEGDNEADDNEDYFHSLDLGHVMYHIERKKISD